MEGQMSNINGYRQNAEQLRCMARRARATGRRVNGFTAEMLETYASRYEEMATSPRVYLALVLQNTRINVAANMRRGKWT